MERHSIQSLIEQGVPMTFTMEIQAPQNNQQLDHAPVIFKDKVTYGQCDPNDVQYWASLAQRELSQRAQNFINQELQQQQGQQGQQGQLRRRAMGGGSSS
jgi:hypothetical protein